MKLDSHFHGRFDGRRSVVAEKNAREGLWREERSQARGEFDGWGICAAEERDMGYAVELLAKGSVDRWVGVAVDVSPDRRVPIQVATTMAVLKHRAFAANEDQWFVIWRAPVLIRGERVPDMTFVQSTEFLRVPNISHSEWVYSIERGE